MFNPMATTSVPGAAAILAGPTLAKDSETNSSWIPRLESSALPALHFHSALGVWWAVPVVLGERAVCSFSLNMAS